MKKAAVIILVVMLMLSAVSVFAEENPEKIQFSFGSMTIEDVAICEKAELGLAHKTMIINGKTTESTFPSIVTAKDGFIYFAIKGQLMNSSVEDILYENMIGSAVFGDNEAIPFRINPIVDVTSDAFKTCYSGSIIDVMAFTTVEKGVLESSDSCVIQVGETTLEYDLSAIDRVEQFGMDAVAEEQKNKSEEKEKNEKSEENTLKKIEYNPEIVIVDEDYLTVYVTSRFADKSFIDHSTPPFYTMGFDLHMINHTSDKYFSIDFSSISFNGMTLGTGFYGCGYVAPESELYTEIKFNRIINEDARKFANLNNVEDMTGIKGVIQVYYNTDGSRGGKGFDKVNFTLGENGAKKDTLSKNTSKKKTQKTNVRKQVDNLKEYSDKQTVKAAQKALNKAGYNCGKPDGSAGKKTKAAISKYQSDKRLTVTGTVTYELLDSLGIRYVLVNPTKK